MDFLPGFLQGMSRVLISHPFDYVRLYLQTNKSANFNDFFKKNSIRSLYRGVGVPLVSVPIDRAIQFNIYEKLNNFNLSPFASGFICGSLSIFFTLPASFIGNNYVLNKNEKSLYNFTKKVLKTPSNLYNGLKPELSRSVIASSIYLGTYGKMREKFGNEIHQSVINGAVAGWSVWTVTYPIETIKVEQQVCNKPVLYILKKRISNFGVLNLWKGISPVYLRTLPSSIIGMTVYEQARKFIE